MILKLFEKFIDFNALMIKNPSLAIRSTLSNEDKISGLDPFPNIYR